MAKTYSATDIQVLEGLDAVRMRPGMYIGSTGSRGLHHLIWEIVDNAIDEASNGYATEIAVTLKKDGSCEVTDNGRGIPVDIHPQLGVSGVEVVYTQLHAGGKFNNKNYAYSGGLHGVGASVVNALSEWVTVDVFRDYSHYFIRFESYEDRKTGKIVSGHAVAPLEKVGNTRKRGTQVCFKPDPRVFEDTRFNGDTVRRRVRELAYLNRGVRFVFMDEREKDEARRRREYCYEGGLADFVRYLNTDKNTLTEPITFEGRRDGTLLRVAIQYTDSYTENIYSFVNNVPTGEGGTHETGFKAAVTKAFNDYARRVGLLKEKDNNLSGEDFREGMTAVVYAGVQKPQFEGQTKGRLGNTEVRPIVEAICLEQLSMYLDDLKNQEVAQRIVEKAVKAARVREAARKARDVARQKNQLEAAPLVGKLSSCTGRNWRENELFIVEGDSAGGSAKQGRDRRFQAILPLRGKPLNAEKKRIDQVLANEEFRSIITALGTGIGEDFDISHLKYNRVIILSDADQDGAHIRAILLTFFFRYMRELVTDGHVYIGMPPLYCAKKGAEHIYCFDDKELARATKKLGRGYTVQRYKGLGEMNPEQLWETTMNPNGRKMVQVTIEDLAEAERRVTVLMGDKVEPRREYIQEYANFNHVDDFEPVREGE
ncbi:MAG TPA: type IIA DNA topoisomerase subunit B [Candidatus Pullichristensenella avicola]|nr:type IIA DNA topoisomerase subunit B [Candidatus Pullichristensenella avicola]